MQFQNRCSERRFSDRQPLSIIYEKVKGDIMTEQERMKAINAKLKEASDKYYLESTQIMTDYEFDALRDELTRLEEKYGVLSESYNNTVGASSYDKADGTKEAHEEKALSLDKTKSRAKLRQWLETKKGCLSWKLDGLTLVATYDNGKITKLVTRGNGTIGTVVNGLIGGIKGLPLQIKYKGHLVVRGESLISYSDFNEVNAKLSDKYENPRNLASGTVTKNDKNVAKERGLSFYAFELVKTDKGMPSNDFSKNLAWLQGEDFYVVEHVVVDKDSILNEIARFEKMIETFDIPSDGLVLQHEDVAYGKSLGMTGKFPRNAIAFKWQDETVSTQITEITYQVGRTGTINPVIHFKPVRLEGTTVSQATGNNVSFMEKHHLTVGSTVEVYKANKIIPTIARNTAPVGKLVLPNRCPSCGTPLQIVESKNAKVLYCMNKYCVGRDIRHFAQFVSKEGMNIDGLAGKTLQTLIERGYIHNYYDIYHLSEHPEIANDDGFGESSYKKLIQAIDKSRETTLGNYLYAFGVNMVGKEVAKEIEKHVGTLPNFIKAMNMNYDFTQIQGIGDKINQNLHSWWYEQRDLFFNLSKELTFKDGVVKVVESAGLAGKTLCFTGDTVIFKNRNEVKAFIESKGGKLTGSVSKKTDYLITNDTTSGSGKNVKAKELGIPVITEQQLVELGR